MTKRCEITIKRHHDEVRGTFDSVETVELEGCLNLPLVIGSFPDCKQELQVGNTVRKEFFRESITVQSLSPQ